MDPNAPRRRERLAVELPAGVSAEGVGLLEMMPLAMSAGAPRRMAMWSADLSRGMEPPMAARGELARLRELVPGRVGPGAPALAATVVQREGDELTLEIEVPEDGWVLPSGAATVKVGRKRIGGATVVPEKSTSPGPHPRGILVKLTLRMEGGVAWPESASIEFEPLKARDARRGHWKGERVTVQYAGAASGGPAQGEPPRA